MNAFNPKALRSRFRLLAFAILLGYCFVFLSADLSAQSVSQLERKRARLEQEVELTQRLLNDTRKVKQQSFNELNLLNKQVRLQQQLLNTVTSEIKEIDADISEMGELIRAMDNDIKQLRESYAEAARVTYVKQSDLSVLLWLLSAESFQQAYDRLMYFRIFSEFRADQIEMIQRTQQFLLRKRKDYLAKRKKKEALLEKRVEEKRKLDRLKSKKRRLVKRLKRQERGYQARLRENKRNLARLKEQIRNLIANENSRTKTRAEQDRIHRLSQSFVQNKRKLPWPIPMPQAVVTSGFGQQTDASGGVVNNEGIYLSTTRGQAVRAIFQGKVTMISEIPSFGKVVIVQHGNFRTVYANLSKVFVREGQQVETLQNLGVVRTQRRTGETQLYFQIYKSFTPIDPMTWLAHKA